MRIEAALFPTVKLGYSITVDFRAAMGAMARALSL
jgi:hypothetical protein